MLVTLDGMVILARALHPANVPPLMLVMLEGMLTLVSALHP
jgi:hypothetical protein